jgi:hypothetical protein
MSEVCSEGNRIPKPTERGNRMANGRSETADEKPMAVDQQSSLTDDQIATKQGLSRRSFLVAAGTALAGGALALAMGTRASAQDQDSDSKPKKKTAASSKKKQANWKENDSDSDKKKTKGAKGAKTKAAKKKKDSDSASHR